MFAQTLLPVLALAGAAAAQTNSACATATATINSQADFTPFASCPSLSGSVVVGSTASGALNLDGPTSIGGSLIVRNASGLVTLGSTSIRSIGGTFELTELIGLNDLIFANLTSVKKVAWTALGRLSKLTFTNPISTADDVLITNTFLSTLNGIDLDEVNTLDINNNNRLTTFASSLQTVGSSLNIVDNGRNLAVTFDNLTWAANATFRNISSISLDSLTTINGSLGFYGTFIESVSAPLLTSVGNFGSGVGSLAFVANSALANISMPLLQSVGGAYQIANNTELSAISFPALENVGGAVDFSGAFSTPELPDLKDVKGGFNVQSKNTISCTAFDKLRGNVIQGKYTCVTTQDAQSNDGTKTSGGGTGTGSSASSTPTNAATLNGASQAVVGMSVVGGLLAMLL